MTAPHWWTRLTEVHKALVVMGAVLAAGVAAGGVLTASWLRTILEWKGAIEAKQAELDRRLDWLEGQIARMPRDVASWSARRAGTGRSPSAWTCT